MVNHFVTIVKVRDLSNKIIIPAIWIIVAVIFIITYGKTGSPYIDCGREAYIPWQMLKGGVLYHDIFNIYSPGAYYLNALLFKIFSPCLNILYFAGLINYCLFLTLLYLISSLFLSRQRSALLVLFTIAVTSVSGNVFNFIFPYSYGMVYGLTAICASLYFLLRGKKDSDYYLAAFLGGAGAVCKYEFVLYFLPLILFSAVYFKSGLKLIKAFLLYAFIPFVSCFALMLQGVSLFDITKEFYILKEMLNSKTMWYFYNISGISFSPKHIMLIFSSFLAFFASMFLIGGKRPAVKVVRFAVVFAAAYFLFKHFTYTFFVFLPAAILCLFIFRFKKIGIRAKILTISAVCISAKVFFSMMIFSYGVYFVGLMFCTACVLIPVKFRKKYLTALFIFVSFLSLQTLQTIKIKTEKIDTPRGILYAGVVQTKPFMQVYDYLKNNTSKEDRILCLPEEPLMNFLLERDTDNYLYSLIPMYVEVFGEYNIINRIAEFSPEYIVVSDWDNDSYYFRFFGKDYALGIMAFIEDNYDKVFETNYGLKHRVYRRKN